MVSPDENNDWKVNMPSATGFEYDGEEGYETDEGSDEADEGSDEADEGFASAEADEGSDEADEGSDEADEGDEGSDERLSDESAFGDRARAQQVAYDRGLAAAQRNAARRARDTQSALNRRFGAIHGAAPVQLQPTGRLVGDGIITAELSNGRRTQLRLTPTLATVRDVNKLTERISANDKRQAKADRVNSMAINRLSAAQQAAVKQLTKQQVESTAMLTKSIGAGDARIDKRITHELSGRTGIASKQRRDLAKVVKTQRMRSIFNAITIGTSLPFFVAYGDKNNPFGRNNLILTGSLAAWVLLDEVVDQFSGKNKSGWTSAAADTWSYLAPIGNAATVYFLLKDEQIERFMTGQAEVTVNPGGTATSVIVPVAENFKKDFAALSNVPVVATIVHKNGGGITDVNANVNNGQLLLMPLGGAAGDKVTVAWIVDTQKPS